MGHTIATWTGRAVLTGAALALLWGLGRMPYGEAADGAVLRLAWRMSGAQVRVCEERSEEDLLRLPPHMRQREVCVDHAVPYRLTVRLDGETRLEREVSPRGAKGDRPIFVQEDLPLAAGDYRVEVDFAPVVPIAKAEGEDDDEGEGDDAAEMREELREAIEDTPRHALDRTLRTAAGRITLIELGEGEGGWRVYEP